MKKKILLVDDEADTHGPFKIRLEEEGYQVLTANEGIAAWEKIKEEKPDLLILDVRMPKLNGEELMQKMREEEVSPRTKIIISTGVSDYGRTEERIKKNFKIEYYLEKPLIVKDLIEKIKLTIGEP